MNRRVRFILSVVLIALCVSPAVSWGKQAVAPRPAATPPQSAPHASSYDDAVAKARSLASQKNFKDAASSAEQAIQIDDKRWEAYVVAAEAYSGQQLYDDAIGMLQAALIHAPQDKKQLIRDAISETRKLLSASATAAPQTTGAPPSTPAQTAPPANNPSSAPTQAEIVLWKSIENSKRADDYKSYLKAYPNGAFAPLAEQRVVSLAENSPDKVIKTQTDWLRGNANASIPGQNDRKGRVVRTDVQAVDSVNGCRVSLSRGYERLSIDFTQIEASAIEIQKAYSGSAFFLVLPVRKGGRAMAPSAPQGTIVPVRFPAQGAAQSSDTVFRIYFADQAIANEAVDRMVQLARACQSASN